MSIWNNLFSWALKTAKNEAQTEALNALQQGANALTQAIQQHTPDVANAAVGEIQKGIAIAVAGAATKQG